MILLSYERPPKGNLRRFFVLENPLSHRCAMPAPPKGGAFAVTAKYPAKPQTFRQRKKAPPERKDFPRSGEDVAQRQIGESGRDQRERTERVQAGTAPLPSKPTALPPSPRGRLWANFPALSKGAPLGELASTARRKGQKKHPRRHKPTGVLLC